MNEEVDFVLDSAQEDMSNAIKHNRKIPIKHTHGKASPAMLGGVMVGLEARPANESGNVNTTDAHYHYGAALGKEFDSRNRERDHDCKLRLEPYE
jgi:hypothetical protein